ncbi:MAG: hypothetical protein ACYC9J_06985 [Sulfuricaulis sp.]
MNAQSPMQVPLFTDLPEAAEEQAHRPKFDRMEFVRRMTAAAKAQEKTKTNTGLSMLKEALSDMVQLTLIGLPEDEMLNWTESDVYAIHESMLIQSLHALKDTRLGEKQFEQIIGWIAEPLLAVEDPEPFSFAACCLCTGVDAEMMQDSLLISIVPSLLKQ